MSRLGTERLKRGLRRQRQSRVRRPPRPVLRGGARPARESRARPSGCGRHSAPAQSPLVRSRRPPGTTARRTVPPPRRRAPPRRDRARESRGTTDGGRTRREISNEAHCPRNASMSYDSMTTRSSRGRREKNTTSSYALTSKGASRCWTLSTTGAVMTSSLDADASSSARLRRSATKRTTVVANAC